MHSEDNRAEPSGVKAYGISMFCELYGISKTFFYELQRMGQGPKVTSIAGRKKLIARDDAESWFEGWRQSSSGSASGE